MRRRRQEKRSETRVGEREKGFVIRRLGKLEERGGGGDN